MSDYCHLKTSPHLHVPAGSPQSAWGQGWGWRFSNGSPKQNSEGNLPVNLGPLRPPSPVFGEGADSPSMSPKSCGLVNSYPHRLPCCPQCTAVQMVSWEQRRKRGEPRILLYSKKKLCSRFGETVLYQKNQFAVISSIPLRRLSLYVHLGSRLESL